MTVALARYGLLYYGAGRWANCSISSSQVIKLERASIWWNPVFCCQNETAPELGNTIPFDCPPDSEVLFAADCEAIFLLLGHSKAYHVICDSWTLILIHDSLFNDTTNNCISANNVELPAEYWRKHKVDELPPQQRLRLISHRMHWSSAAPTQTTDRPSHVFRADFVMTAVL